MLIEAFEDLDKQTQAYMNAVDAGADIEDVLSGIYMDNLPDKTMEQGRLMANLLLGSVDGFDGGYRQAMKDMQAYLLDFQQKMEEGKSDAQTCMLWMRVAMAAAAVAADADGRSRERADLLAQMDQVYIHDEEATPERLAALREEAMEALSQLADISSYEEMMRILNDKLEAEELVIDVGDNPRAYRALMAMLLYVGIKNDRYPELPADTTLQQMAVLVCGGMEMLQVAEAVGVQTKSQESGLAQMSRLSMMMNRAGIHAASAVGAAMGLSVFGFLSIAPAYLLMVKGALVCAGKGVAAWEREHDDVIVKKQTVNTKQVVSGMRSMAAQTAHWIDKTIEQAGERFVRVVKRVFEDQRQAAQVEQTVKETQELEY